VLPLSPGQSGGEHKSVPWLNESYNVDQARLSPDSKWIAYRSGQTGRGEIFVRTFPNPGFEWQVSSSGARDPVWSRDGKELYYIALDGYLMAVEVKSRPDGKFEHGVAKRLFNPNSGPIPADTFNVTKDGRFLIPSLAQQPAAPITVIVNWQAGLK
jgi:hypothetical protein